MPALSKLCPFCGSTTVQTRFESINIRGCQACGFEFRDPPPTPEALVAHYRDAYSPENVASGTTVEAGTKPWHAANYVSKLLAELGRSNLDGQTILEFGAGPGIMADALKAVGARVIAVEPYAYEYCEKLGIETYRSLEELPVGLSVDGVVAIDVIEHLSCPWVELSKLRQLLVSDGWLYVSTLNVRCLNAIVFRDRWREFLKPDHLSFFTPKSLRRILASAGYRDSVRLRWRIRYHRNPLRALINTVLQSTGMEGELRFICRAANMEA